MIDKEKKSKINERQLVIFSLAKEAFGVDISEVKEIFKIEDITPIPNVEEYIKGVINLRGRIVVVISLAKKLNLDIKKTDKNTRIIIIETGDAGGNVVGMIVDSVEEVLRVTQDKISPAPEMITKEINADYLEGVCVLKERLIILLDLAKMLSIKDVAQINKISEADNKNDAK